MLIIAKPCLVPLKSLFCCFVIPKKGQTSPAVARYEFRNCQGTLIAAIPTVHLAAGYSLVFCRIPFYKDSYCTV